MFLVLNNFSPQIIGWKTFTAASTHFTIKYSRIFCSNLLKINFIVWFRQYPWVQIYGEYICNRFFVNLALLVHLDCLVFWFCETQHRTRRTPTSGNEKFYKRNNCISAESLKIMNAVEVKNLDNLRISI